MPAKKSTVVVMVIVFALGMACTASAFFFGNNLQKLFEVTNETLTANRQVPSDAGLDDGGDY